MAEFTELPISDGSLVPRAIYNELLSAINNRRSVVLPDATAAFTIYNSAGDATSATVEIDTAADEIYLVVVGGADASNTTLDLTAAAYDTIAELVAAINALGFSWVAAETSGAQTDDAGNASQTLLSSGPANVLGSAAITWFTNYAPNGVHSGALIGDIVAYRAAIDLLVDYFYTSGTSRTLYTADTLHAVAFGYNDWDPVGAPNLTPPCLPHKKLWNDMKACLDLLIWIRFYRNTDGSFPFINWWDYATDSHYRKNIGFEENWNTARGSCFAGLVVVAPMFGTIIGRRGTAGKDSHAPDPDTYDAAIGVNTELSKTFATAFDWADIINSPTVEDGYAIVNWAATADYATDVEIDWKLAGAVVAGSPFTFDPSVDTGFIPKQLDAANLAALNFDTSDNVWKLLYGGTITGDIGAGEWPAPNFGPTEFWDQGFLMQGTDAIFLELSWD